MTPIRQFGTGTDAQKIGDAIGMWGNNPLTQNIESKARTEILTGLAKTLARMASIDKPGFENLMALAKRDKEKPLAAEQK